MATSEETLLKEYYHSLSVEADEIAELKLNAAVRMGMARSRKVTLSLRARYVLGSVAVLAILLLFSLPWASEALKPQTASQAPQVTAQNLEWFWDYSNFAGSDSTVISAFEAGSLKQLSGATAEKDGYILTVDSIAVDRMGILVLYSLENKNKEALDYSFSVTNDGDMVLGQGQWVSGNQNDLSGVKHGYQIIQWNRNYTKLPVQIMMKASVIVPAPSGEKAEGLQSYEPTTEISVPITLDQSAIAKSGETLTLNKTVNVAGQDIGIRNVYVAATGIYVETAYSPQNSMEIFSLNSPHILLGGGNDFTALYSKASINVEGKQYLVFPGSELSPGTMKLQIDGIIGLEKSAQELIVDTDKKQIIKGPDGRLRITAASNPHSLIMEYQRPSNKSAGYIANVILDRTFKDGVGKLHTATYNSAVPAIDPAHADEKVPPIQFGYKLGTAELPQPLTFKIISYPNLIKGSAELTLRK
ncbi:hypothetical protein [Paenibacillus sp. FSL R5-0912]|uniref:hypothetical protein n=1 Tax=Paenibacillus sp. FSL R5-0912 TaxID=1536771 RepID=UPI0004F80A3A|nr:hypothetical protein [Paenibacillus sp. FSL R5-0912]AIQ41121.1 hypothetical protein R50912_14650 [Paenibacillus sp. FSL R5-0912]